MTNKKDDPKPRPKVVGGTLGAAIAGLITYMLETGLSTDFPTPVEYSIIVVVGFVVAYFVPDHHNYSR